MSTDNLKKLRDPFPDHQISLLPRPTKKDNPKGNCHECGGYHGIPAVHLKYVGHAALTDRLLDVDPLWNWEPFATENGLPKFDANGGLWIRLTVCGHTRMGYGNAEASNFKDIGSREKEVIGDALRNAAMRFGAALELWHKGDLHVQDQDAASQPQPNNWSFKQFNDHLTPEEIGTPSVSYRIPFGKFKFKTLEEVPMKDLEDYVIYLEDKAKKENKEIVGQVREFIDNAVNFINSFEQEYGDKK